MPPLLPAFRQPAVPALAALLATALILLLAIAATPARAGVFTGDPVVGPSPAVHALHGIDLAPDGSGAIVYTMDDGGVEHVFVRRLVNGAWGAPERLDADLGGAATQAAVAAGDGGRVLVVFANGGNVYASTRPDSGTAWARQTLWSGGGASDPAVDLSVNGKGYAAFAAPGAGGHDVRAAFARDAGAWTVIGAPLDANAGNDAGAGTARPRVAASADGVAIVVWGEAGNVIARRVQGARPSIVAVDALAGLTVEGVQAAAADLPVVSTQDDDSFTGVAFRATFDLGGGTLRSRAVFRRLRGSRFESPAAVEGSPFASGQGSGAPHIATVGTGQGLVVAGNDTTNATSALQLLFDIEPSTLLPLDSLVTNSAPGFAVPATATARKMLVAWQVTPAGGTPEIHARYRDGGDFEAEQVVSRGDLGPTDAADGLLTATDDAGDIAVAYAQDVPGQGRAIAVATVDQPPGRFAVERVAGFQRSDRPSLAWTTSRETWGRYFKVTIDGVQAGVTGRRSFRPSAPLAQGVHSWQVVAYDRRGQQYTAAASSVKIDSVPAFVTARLSGARQAGTALRLAVQATDTPTGTARKAAGILTSGVREILVNWGDRTPVEQIRRGSQHAYARPGRYVLRLLVTDKAGNRTSLRQVLRIAKPPRPTRGARSRRRRSVPAPILLLRSEPPRRAPVVKRQR
ncbi:MAG TPA: hypothetical protein VKB25_15845 [Conexibacter sp.]|nr:hypothetical protein [Conexibacter sp.]